MSPIISKGLLCCACIGLVIFLYKFKQTRQRLSSIETFDEEIKYARENDMVYSGDIITLTMGKLDRPRFLQRRSNDSVLVMSPRLGNLKTNLSKLRFQRQDHDPLQIKSLHFQETVHILHNANMHNRNMPLYIKISDALLSHQKGELFRDFVLIKMSDPASKTKIRPGVQFAIKNLQSAGIQSGFLKVDSNSGQISNTATSLSDATAFHIDLERPVEAFDRHLCACSGDVIFA